MKNSKAKTATSGRIKLFLGVLALILTGSGCQTFPRDSANQSLENLSPWPQLSKSQWQTLDTTTLSDFLENHGINDQDGQGNTALFYAAELNTNPEVFNLLIDRGADKSHKNFQGLTALHIGAAFNQNPQIIETLIQSPGILGVVDQWGRDPAAFAILANHSYPVIARVLQAELTLASTNPMPDAWPALSAQEWATMDLAQLDRILTQGYSPNQRSPNGRSGLHFAALYSSDPELIIGMIDRGFSVNARDSRRWTPGITAAVMNPRIEITQLLYEKESSFDTANPLDHSVFHFTGIMNPNPQIMSFLISRLQTPDLPSMSGITPIMAAAWAAQQDGGILSLLQGGAKIQQKDNQGRDVLTFLQDNPALSQTQGYWSLLDAYYGP